MRRKFLFLPRMQKTSTDPVLALAVYSCHLIITVHLGCWTNAFTAGTYLPSSPLLDSFCNGHLLHKEVAICSCHLRL